MKTFIGIFVTLLILAGGTLVALAIWDIHPVSWELIWKTGLTLIVSSVVLSLVWQAGYTFFRKEKHRNDGNNAHRMN